jgi:transcription-repair coupling factor (superfamily II helicase)
MVSGFVGCTYLKRESFPFFKFHKEYHLSYQSFFIFAFSKIFPLGTQNNQLLELYASDPYSVDWGNPTSKEKRIHLKNLSGSSKSIAAGNILASTSTVHLFVLQDKEEAAYFYNDLLELLGDKAKIMFYPASYQQLNRQDKIDNENIVLRTEVLNELSKFHKRETAKKALAIVTYPEALSEKVVSKQKLSKNTSTLAQGEQVSLEFLTEVLSEYKFERVDFVYEPGQYSVRGGIVDIFSFSYDRPFRVDFFGDEVSSIRSFNLETQLSEETVKELSIVPNLQDYEIEITRETFLDYLPQASALWFNNKKYILSQLDVIYEKSESYWGHETTTQHDKGHFLTTGANIYDKSKAFKNVEISNVSEDSSYKVYEFHTSPQPSFNKNFEFLVKDLSEKKEDAYHIYIVTNNAQQVERLNNILNNLNANIDFTAIPCVVHEGFVDHAEKVLVYTDHQIFDRYHKYQLPNKFSKKEVITLKEFNQLQPGDYVVHVDHGIGKFGGLEKININGKMQETIRLVYRDNDVLFVNIHNLHKISKYKGKEGGEPKIYKLGTGAWQKLKQNTKRKVKDIARELITLYAQRKTQQGFAFSADTYLQNELEASFFFEDTPDQVKATKAVKEQMEQSSPMDVLVCGDVGFGKTEVAIRAAFKAVADSKQVAVLVPTTILALQHYQTFKSRLKDFPCTIDYINRHKSRKEQNAVIDGIKKGEIDILIGTHRLVGKDIDFKDLGLLIIDEEQKFGVGVKEKLRQMKLNIDTLTMTATPIPRTLQFSMMGARDLAIISTPPPNRYPIVTEVHFFNEAVIKEGIEYEVSRGGQVFFIHNRVQNIEEVQKLLRHLCPQVKTVVAHGQMDGKQLEQIMVDFISGDYDVLIATTIIESGLDIPNANTIFINNAQNFGLSDLHQLRGRVGRSNKKAFCYLMAPPPTALTQEARRRLKAIEEFSELGSGLNIAMQDLDIRGAGNLLGGEQSGFIADIGFETYHQILDEAVQELKEQEFQGQSVSTGDRFREDAHEDKDKTTYIKDCQIDTDFEILFPDSYIENISERIKLYRRLDGLKTDDELTGFEKMLADRFGPLPTPTKELLDVVRLRWMAISLGFETIILKNGKMIAHFVANQESKYYQTELFMYILRYVQEHPKKFKMKQGPDKLSLIAEGIQNVNRAIALLENMKPQ